MICRECDQEIKNGAISAKDVIALNRKLLGRRITQFFCAGCLAEYLDIPAEDLPDIVERFRAQGCTLFG
jgi:hypothetical protein